MRIPPRPELLPTAVGVLLVGLLCAFPPWRGTAIATTHRAPAWDFERHTLDVPGDTGSTQIDTLTWSIPFASILSPPRLETHEFMDPIIREVRHLKTDTTLTASQREQIITRLVKDAEAAVLVQQLH